MTFFSDTSGLHIREGGKSLQRSSRPPGGRRLRLEGSLRATDLPAELEDKKLIAYVDRFAGEAGELAQQRSDYATQVESLDRDIEQFQHLKGWTSTWKAS